MGLYDLEAFEGGMAIPSLTSTVKNLPCIYTLDDALALVLEIWVMVARKR